MREKYGYTQEFQENLLSLMIRKPDRVCGLVKPSYFTDPIFREIAGVVAKTYEKHPNTRLTKPTLLESLLDKRPKPKDRHTFKRIFRHALRQVFGYQGSDDDVVAERAVEFAREQKYRQALVEMERDVNNRQYERAHRRLEELAPQVNVQQSGQYDWESLPRFDPTAAPETKWLYEDFIPERAITFVVADAGSFKSTFMLALCTAISTGEDFLDRPTKKRRVLYLDNENPPDVLRERNEAMELELEANKRMRIWSMYGGVPLPKLGSPELREIVKASMAESRKPLIVFDHWASFLRPGDGGETTGQTSALLQDMKFLCGLGATIVVLAHTLKYDKTTWYGGADIRAKADAMHTFIREQDPVHPDRTIIRVKCFLKRHGGERTFAIQPIIKDGRVAGFRSVEDPKKHERKMNIEKLRDLIKKSPEASQRTLANLATAIGFGRDEAESLLKQGIGKYWKLRKGEKGKMTYRLLKHHH